MLQWFTLQPTGGEGMFAGNSLTVCSQLDPVKGGAGGDAAGHRGFEQGCGVHGPVEDGQGPHHGEADGGVASNQESEIGVEEEVLTLVGKALRVGYAGKGRQAAAQKINIRWLRPPVVKKLTTGPLHGFCQAEAVHVMLSNLCAKAP